ncbi:hypothetical protein Q8791_22910 [Nocardiopsis sp. CT-R113]|uniref:Uncharacterized protein n=1 Tax=Nocardiopsis codii TaxID=3065942 RepID=A0ABU7KCW2_9ACTN|nr:hypothetical protein [Nocardiopsis sp. CT-R113]MEE2040071.1 hypothetical protein [Nocardiopsis sp. CT-R113]
MSWKAGGITFLVLVGGTGFFAAWSLLAAAAIRHGDPLLALVAVCGPIIVAVSLLAAVLFAGAEP